MNDIQTQHNFVNRTTDGSELEDMIPISIEDSSSTSSTTASKSESSKSDFLPSGSLAPSEPNFYEWKEITGDFFGAVKGEFRVQYKW